MSLNPLNELKRRLENDKTPLPKRLCLAKNVVQSYHFSTAPKERIVGEWLQSLADKNSLKNDQLKGVLDWLSGIDDLTNDLKSKLIWIVSHYLKRYPLQSTDIHYILLFLENSKISSQLSIQIDDYLSIAITLLQSLRYMDTIQFSVRIMNNILKYYRESKKKFDFIVKLLNGENLETIFSYLDTNYRKSAIDICQNILFPINKKTYFISFLQTLIRKDNIEELIAEKGDNIQSVIKIMNTFFEFPKNRSSDDSKFLYNFIDVFVSSFGKENQVIFAFYIMVANVLQMEQNFITPAMNLPPILNENNVKTKRNLFLNMLEVLLSNEIDINVRLTDTFGEKISKVEIKKNFTSFLQAVMMGQLKLEGKLDKITLHIIKVALKLDPILIEQKQLEILPAIITAKKNNTNTMESYIEMMNCLLEILFKLSREPLFITEILPSIKNILEASNTEQFELKQKVKEAKESGVEYEKMQSKIITGSDLFPQECVIVYGKLTSELMFRQNKELLESLQKDLEIYCLMMLEEGFVSPSIIVLTEVLSAILGSFLDYNKMADHTVPMNIAGDFWNTYKKFEDECLSKFGQCVLKLSYNPQLVQAFLKLCQSFAQLKLFNIKYSNVKLNIYNSSDTTDLFDLSNLLTCLNKDQWAALGEKIEDDEVLFLDNLLLTKIMANQLLSVQNNQENTEDIMTTKAHLIKQISVNPTLLQNNYFCKLLFLDLDKSHTKQLAKCLIKLHMGNPLLDILTIDAITNNRELLNCLVMETAKNLTKCFENKDPFSKMITKTDCDISNLKTEIDFIDCLNQINIKQEAQDEVKNYLNIFKQLQIFYLEEKYQLVAIFLMLAIKKSTTVKKLKRTIDNLLQSIYEMSLQQPDLYQIFPVESIFSFQDNSLLDLLTLKLKNSNNLLIIKSLLELAVKKVRVDSQLVKTIVENLLKKNKKKISDIESFNDHAFQISCLILPLIVKQKKAITASAFRSILSDLQEQLHKALLKSFKNIKFNSSISVNNTDNTDDSLVETESSAATFNAMAAFSITLSKYCETTDGEEIKNLDCLWSGLEYFLQSAIKSIETPDSKLSHIDSSIQLLNVILRHIKKLETHSIFVDKDKIFLQIYRCVKYKLKHEQNKKMMSSVSLEELGVTLKFVCELSSVECYGNHFIGDLANLVILKKPSLITKDDNTNISSRKVFKYLWSQCLKANIVGSKCVAMSKLMHRICKNLRNWIRQHYIEDGVATRNTDNSTENGSQEKIMKVDDGICEMIKLDLDSLSELILAAKKISLDYKFVDSIFELQHLINYILYNRSDISCDISWDSFFLLYDACIAVLNSLIMAREEILEDRWPCYMQCYRALVTSLCERSTSHIPLDRNIEERLAEKAHHIEKLTQSIVKRKKHVSRIAAYTVGDICTLLEVNAPTKMVRQHMENSVALLIQASDSSYAMPFLKRALAGSPGQMTMTNLYTMYKRLTQSIVKRKKHVSRIAAYTVGDICTLLEVNAPTKMVRQHMENSVALLIQASDSSYAMPFLKRALAGSPGQMTMTNLYTMYKRYHKYFGNSKHTKQGKIYTPENFYC